ncbi:E3 ubiquitin-protein ligase RNF13-like [Sitophilus oryzae]|uniref:E3 ubiquitin-protein ligase RNF13-like n=1 Tax=Sitophilus oryzae TaxID=7048 RepID=A0A6J2X695_SITOR|nr:E3 ubiquitin-protein ligase RNF13-like [Sitophilus oryzae]XP_030746718.1 E3 ubiquitin-protein ligase RNF13-like [Sitophilus oryzae]XP_030761260.1 E3 ubiquitin-protein ligase RNF13-like [Sitophilus oryzae]
MHLQIIFLVCISILQLSDAEIYAIKFNSDFYFEEFADEPAKFGPSLDGAVRGLLTNADPPSACNSSLQPPKPYNSTVNELKNWILLVPRYTDDENCTFEVKVRMAQLRGYNAVIVYNVGSDDLVPMSSTNSTGINIPSVFVGQTSGIMLKEMYTNKDYFVVITAQSPFDIKTHLLIPFAIVVGICFIVMIIFMVVKYIKDRRRQRRHRLPTSQLNKLPTCKYQKGDRYETCAICLEDYIEGEKLRVLPCNHVYHIKCIDPWLTKNKRVCPICKRKVFAQNEPQVDSDSDSDTDDTTPLIRAGNRGTQGGTFEVQNENPIQRAARSVSQQSGAGNFVTASDHHSINGDRVSTLSRDTSDTVDTESSSNTNQFAENQIFKDLEVHVHQADAQSQTSNSDINV